jgi:hypothetical protein
VRDTFGEPVTLSVLMLVPDAVINTVGDRD